MEDPELRKAAAAAVTSKFEELMADRRTALEERAALDRRIRNLDRGLFDCRAAGRLFGVDILLPEDVRPGMMPPPPNAAQRAGGDFRVPQRFGGGPSRPIGPTGPSAAATSPRPPAGPIPALSPPALTGGPTGPSLFEAIGPTPHTEPSVRELVIDYLKTAYPNGIKATLLRRSVEAQLNRQIHYKTIGMSLYRLSKEDPPVVKRDGLNWFFVPPETATKNPGAATPGSIEGR
jgi:hypothetical protein